MKVTTVNLSAYFQALSGRAVLVSYFAVSCLLLFVLSTQASAQSRHMRHSGELPPGSVGREQAAMHGSFRGYFQPVEIVGPKGSRITMMASGTAAGEPKTRIKAGMLIGEVYQCKVTQIPKNLGAEIFPTIEVINRLYPPEGLATKYPIPVILTQEDIESALKGAFVTRIVYLENPREAAPVPQEKDQQTVYDVDNRQDPLAIADRMGRPMVIVRIGSRIPAADDNGYGAPQIQEYEIDEVPIEKPAKIAIPASMKKPVVELRIDGKPVGTKPVGVKPVGTTTVGTKPMVEAEAVRVIKPVKVKMPTKAETKKDKSPAQIETPIRIDTRLGADLPKNKTELVAPKRVIPNQTIQRVGPRVDKDLK